MSLDQIDKRLLEHLQHNSDLSLDKLAEQVGLSKNPCWRRVKRMQEQGIIKSRVSLLDRHAINLGVVVFMNIGTDQHSAAWLKKFTEAVETIPEIVEFYRMSGEVDYLLKVVVPDIESFDRVYKQLINRVEIFKISSHFAMEELKHTTELPLTYA